MFNLVFGRYSQAESMISGRGSEPGITDQIEDSELLAPARVDEYFLNRQGVGEESSGLSLRPRLLGGFDPMRKMAEYYRKVAL